jgi:hypothetical protein
MGNALQDQGKLEEAIEAYQEGTLTLSLIMLKLIITWAMLSKSKES